MEINQNKKDFESRVSEDRYRLFVNSVKDYGLFLLDVDGTIVSWNLGAQTLKGYSAEEIIGQNFSKFYSEEDILRGHPEYELKLASETGRYEEEGWRVRKNGTRFWASIVITRLTDADGKVIGFGKVTRDLSERKKAEEALRESEERFRLMVSSVKDYAIIMLSPDGIITSWNEGAARVKGWTADEIIGRHFSAFYEPEEIATGKCEYELTEATKTGRFEDEGWRLRKDGTKFWANVIITVLFDSQGCLRGFSKVTRDVTERKRAEDKLRMAHEGLELRVQERTTALQKAIESRDEFLSIASHELRTPLTALKLHYQIFERQIRKTDMGDPNFQKAMDIINMAARQVNQLTRLVEDMLDVSRISTGRLPLQSSLVDISDLLNRVVAGYESQFENAVIPFTSEVQPGLFVSGDSQRIEQVVANLLSNAIKYGEKSAVSVKAKATNGFIEISVRDRGPGILEKDIDRIFQRFERAVSATEVSGLGLGLFISRQIAEALGGHLKVESKVGEGSNFLLCLPLRK